MKSGSQGGSPPRPEPPPSSFTLSSPPSGSAGAHRSTTAGCCRQCRRRGRCHRPKRLSCRRRHRQLRVQWAVAELRPDECPVVSPPASVRTVAGLRCVVADLWPGPIWDTPCAGILTPVRSRGRPGAAGKAVGTQARRGGEELFGCMSTSPPTSVSGLVGAKTALWRKRCAIGDSGVDKYPAFASGANGWIEARNDRRTRGAYSSSSGPPAT